MRSAAAGSIWGAKDEHVLLPRITDDARTEGDPRRPDQDAEGEETQRKGVDVVLWVTKNLRDIHPGSNEEG